MKAIRLPGWDEILAPEAPWAFVLRSGGAGLWLLRGAAEDDGVDARVVAAGACRTSAGALVEWSAALELADTPTTWDGFAEAVVGAGWMRAEACGVLVADAERLLAEEPARLPALLASVRSAADGLAVRGFTLRFVFQSRFDAAPERLAVFREFDVPDVG